MPNSDIQNHTEYIERMKKLFIIANWKSNETAAEASQWLEKVKGHDLENISLEKEIIVCPAFTSLPLMEDFISKNNLPIKLGAQDISPFDQGAFTGEENVNQIKEFADYVIIGHSERRKNFSETDEIIFQKAQKAISGNLKPIFCIQGVDTPIPDGIEIVAYEPISAIGTGEPDTPEDAESVAKAVKEKNGVRYVLYGGSVTGDNVGEFTNLPSVDGVLVGGASLDAEKFMQIIINA